MTADFTLKKWGWLLSEIRRAGVPLYSVEAWMREKPAAGVFVRHDVDRWPRNALETALLEASLGVKSTYYFRILPHVYKPEIIEAVAAAGHEIGYHYEDLALAKGDMAEAIRLFERHLAEFRRLVPVRTIAMHGSPLSPRDNRDLWKEHDFRRFDLAGEAFLSIDYSDTYYFTDTGRTWGETKANLRDRPAANLNHACGGTDELAAFLRGAADKKTAIVMHPERWNDDPFGWGFQLVRDNVFNAAKLTLRAVRG